MLLGVVLDPGLVAKVRRAVKVAVLGPGEVCRVHPVVQLAGAPRHRGDTVQRGGSAALRRCGTAGRGPGVLSGGPRVLGRVACYVTGERADVGDLEAVGDRVHAALED